MLQRAAAATTTAQLRVVVLEIGCGSAVPVVRQLDEELVEQLKATGPSVHASLVRVNPALPLADRKSVRGNIVPLMCNGLETVRRIDAALRQMRRSAAGP